MRITDINLTPTQISGNDAGIGILIDVTPGYEYYNGKRTDTLSHWKYSVVFTDNNYEKVTVKVPGTKEVVSKELLKQQHKEIKVKFAALTGKFYRSNNDYLLSCSASNVELLP